MKYENDIQIFRMEMKVGKVDNNLKLLEPKRQDIPGENNTQLDASQSDMLVEGEYLIGSKIKNRVIDAMIIGFCVVGLMLSLLMFCKM